MSLGRGWSEHACPPISHVSLANLRRWAPASVHITERVSHTLVSHIAVILLLNYLLSTLHGQRSWWAAVLGVAKSQTPLSDKAQHSTCIDVGAGNIQMKLATLFSAVMGETDKIYRRCEKCRLKQSMVTSMGSPRVEVGLLF